MIELDLFDGIFSGMKLAEVEFDSETLANTFCPPDWFGEDVTFSPQNIKRAQDFTLMLERWLRMVCLSVMAVIKR